MTFHKNLLKMVLVLKGKIFICFSFSHSLKNERKKTKKINKIKYVSRLESFSICLFNDFRYSIDNILYNMLPTGCFVT